MKLARIPHDGCRHPPSPRNPKESEDVACVYIYTSGKNVLSAYHFSMYSDLNAARFMTQQPFPTTSDNRTRVKYAIEYVRDKILFTMMR